MNFTAVPNSIGLPIGERDVHVTVSASASASARASNCAGATRVVHQTVEDSRPCLQRLRDTTFVLG
eukprot:5341962-Lingulodinium_polyedra.AAC.1